MLRLALVLFSAAAVSAQTAPASSRPDQNPPVKVNVLNVCTPDGDAQQEIKAALSRLPKTPAFSSDYEVSRGVSTLDDGRTSRYIRLRRDLKSDSSLATIQYSLSADPSSTVETLVFRGRDVKELLALSIEDKLSTSASKPLSVIQSDTPASRVRVERAGKTTLGLARCEDVSQSQYEPIFAQASTVLANYRRALRLRSTLASELTWLTPSSENKNSQHSR